MRTDIGRDWQAGVMGDPASNGSGDYAPAAHIGLSIDGSAPDPVNTSLPGEITTGTLARALAAFAHTDGTATYTLTKTFTSDQTVTVAKIGVFTALAGGTLVFETLLSSPAALVSGDQLALTETVTL